MNDKVISKLFKYYQPVEDRLISYGFQKENNNFYYQKDIVDELFTLYVMVLNTAEITTKVIEKEVNEEYFLHKVDGATGAFVGKVKDAYENTLKDIRDHCFLFDVFQNPLAKQAITYIQDAFNSALEFLWENYIDTAIWRCRENQKWFGTIMNISKRKLDLDSDEIVTIINVRISSEKLEDTIDNKIYFKAYHMNKKHWISILLDEQLSFKELKQRIDESYQSIR